MNKPDRSLPLLSMSVLTGLLAISMPMDLMAQVLVQTMSTEPGCEAVTVRTCALSKELGRGVNFGNMLEAPREGDYGLKVEQHFIDTASAVFKTIRLPVRWSNHAAPTEDATLDEVFAKRVDGIVDQLLAKGMTVILDMHGYNQLVGDGLTANEYKVDASVLELRWVNIWKQLGERYRDRSPKLIFELLNEPHGKLDGEPWNVLVPKGLAAVRQSNPTRTVMIGPTYWNSVRDLQRLKMPADLNLILSIHNYDPFGFTHQGASWIPASIQQVGSVCCDAGQTKQITDALDAAKRWSIAKGFPVHLGEFGSYRTAPMSARATYTRVVRDAAEARGFGWTYWEFASSFGVYDPLKRQWIEPLRSALLD